jgi:hypothetical protein
MFEAFYTPPSTSASSTSAFEWRGITDLQFDVLCHALHTHTFNPQFAQLIVQEVLRTLWHCVRAHSMQQLFSVKDMQRCFALLVMVLRQLTHLSNAMGNQRIACDEVFRFWSYYVFILHFVSVELLSCLLAVVRVISGDHHFSVVHGFGR